MIKQRANIHSNQRGRHETKIRKCRITAANIVRIHKDTAESIFPCQLFERRPGIGNRGKISTSQNSLALAHLLEEVGAMRKRLDSATRLARHQEQSPNEVDLLLHRPNLGGYRRIEHVQAGITGCAIKRTREDFG